MIRRLAVLATIALATGASACLLIAEMARGHIITDWTNP